MKRILQAAVVLCMPVYLLWVVSAYIFTSDHVYIKNMTYEMAKDEATGKMFRQMSLEFLDRRGGSEKVLQINYSINGRTDNSNKIIFNNVYGDITQTFPKRITDEDYDRKVWGGHYYEKPLDTVEAVVHFSDRNEWITANAVGEDKSYEPWLSEEEGRMIAEDERFRIQLLQMENASGADVIFYVVNRSEENLIFRLNSLIANQGMDSEYVMSYHEYCCVFPKGDGFLYRDTHLKEVPFDFEQIEDIVFELEVMTDDGAGQIETIWKSEVPEKITANDFKG